MVPTKTTAAVLPNRPTGNCYYGVGSKKMGIILETTTAPFLWSGLTHTPILILWFRVRERPSALCVIKNDSLAHSPVAKLLGIGTMGGQGRGVVSSFYPVYSKWWTQQKI